MTTTNKSVKLLYIMGIKQIDKLIETKYQGEDVFVFFSIERDKIALVIDDFKMTIYKSDISAFQLFYEDGQLSFEINSSECIFSYEHKFPFELLCLLNYLNSNNEIPEFLISRYQQMLNKDLFLLIDEAKSVIPEHAYVHFYNNIDETQYACIIESFATDAICDVPLLYVKYQNSSEEESGLLITYNKIYSYDNTIKIKDVNSMHMGQADGLNYYINGVLFSELRVIMKETIYIPIPHFSLPVHLNEFPINQLLNLISRICICLNK